MRPITAGDLMNPEVLSVREGMTIQELASFLTDQEITGAPVQGEDGKVVGVVSVVDIAALASDKEGVEIDRSNPEYYVRGWEGSVDLEEMKGFRVDPERVLVGEIMTPAVYSVGEDTPVGEVAAMMLEGHLHRLLVIRDDKPVGMITTSDLLGLLVEEG